MNMKAEMAAIVAASALLAGCSPVEPGSREPDQAPSFPTSESYIPPFEKVDFGSFPKALPQAVGRQAINAVAFSVDIKGKRIPLGKGMYEQKSIYSSYFSGVRISRDEYVGPGHGLVDEKGPVKNIDQCNAVSIAAHSTGSTAQAGYNKPLYGTDTWPTKQYTEFSGLNYSKPDIALFEAVAGLKQVAYRKQSINNTPLRIGQQLFFVNYEPTATGTLRTPSEADNSNAPLSRVAKYAQPAEYGGVVVGVESNNDVEVAVGMKSYGVIKEAYTRGGASGGGVYLKDGSLAGLSVRADVEKATETKIESEKVTTLAKEYGLKATGINPDVQLQITVVQPLTSATLNTLETGLKNAPTCLPSAQ